MSLRDQLIRHEGLRLKAYKCTAGKWTIGVGRNLDDKGITPEETAALGITRESCLCDGITEAQAYVLLENDIRDARAEAAKLPVFHMLDPVRQDALVNMAFNLGLPRLSKFKRMLAALEDADWQGAAQEALESKWAKQVGPRAYELAKQLQTGIMRA